MKKQNKCRCGRPGIYWEPCENRYYCKRCLIRKTEKKFKKNIKHSKLLESKRIAVAINGRADSAVLLYLLHETMKHRKDDLVPILIDEGISGYRNKSNIKAKQLCKKLGLKLLVFSFKNEFKVTIDDIARKFKKTGFKNEDKICTYCRILRRYVLNKKARLLKTNVVCVGHNLEDEVESIVMNFFRGDLNKFERIDIVSGILRNKKFVPRVKLLRNIYKNEIRTYAKIKKIPLYSKNCKYSYDNFRKCVSTPLENLEKKYPGSYVQIINFYDKLKPKMKNHTKGKIILCKECGEPSTKEKCKTCLFLKQLK